MKIMKSYHPRKNCWRLKFLEYRDHCKVWVSTDTITSMSKKKRKKMDEFDVLSLEYQYLSTDADSLISKKKVKKMVTSYHPYKLLASTVFGVLSSISIFIFIRTFQFFKKSSSV